MIIIDRGGIDGDIHIDGDRIEAAIGVISEFASVVQEVLEESRIVEIMVGSDGDIRVHVGIKAPGAGRFFYSELSGLVKDLNEESPRDALFLRA